MEHCGIAIKPLMLAAEGAEACAVYEAHRPPSLFLMTIPDAWFDGRAGCQCLTEADRSELAGMRSGRRQAQFAAGRVLLRHALQRVMGGDRAQWEIRRSESGAARPVRAGAEAKASISHSGTFAFCGVVASGKLGVDVERCRPRRSDWPALSAAVLHPIEQQRLAHLPPAPRWHGFYRAWTLKEALGKACGVGLALDFPAIAFSDDARLIAAPGWLMEARASWSFATLDLGPDAVGSVAWSPS